MGIATSDTWDKIAEAAEFPGEPDYLELPESGWGALIAWLAERGQVVRSPIASITLSRFLCRLTMAERLLAAIHATPSKTTCRTPT